MKKFIIFSGLTFVFIFIFAFLFYKWRTMNSHFSENIEASDRISYRFYGFGADSVPGFYLMQNGWQDTLMASNLEILLLGDVHNSITQAQWRLMSQRHPTMDCYAQLGDMVENNDEYHWQTLARQMQKTRFINIPIINCPGNHEYTNKGLVKKLEENWFSLFKHPDNGPVELKKTSYYVDFPNLRFIVINTNEIRGIKSLTRMQTWVLECIKTAGSRFTLVMMHHPIYSSCMRRHNLILQLFFRCLKGKADVVFAGHDHNYCRRMPFINTNSSTKYYLNKLNIEDERVACGVQLYSYITVMRDTMTVQAFLLSGGAEYDKIQIVKRARAKELIDYYSQKTDEILLLPQSYTSRKSRKQKIFLERRELRQKGS